MTATRSGAIQTQYRTIDGLNVRFAESDARDEDALLLSPWPESLFAFDQMWDRLAEHTHLVAVDLVRALRTPRHPAGTAGNGRVRHPARGRVRARASASEVDRGGHFAAWEQPALFADEVRGAFRSLR